MFCYGCTYGEPIHNCPISSLPYRPRSEFNTVQEWIDQHVSLDTDTPTVETVTIPKVEYKSEGDRREEIKKRLAELRK